MSVTDSNVLETADGLKYFAPEREAAWIGLLQAHAELTRGLDAALSARHGLSFSAYEVLSRIAHADGGHLRMSILAERSQLSLSRVSRVIDALEQRGLIERSSNGRGRALPATLTPKGRRVLADCERAVDELEDEMLAGLGDRERARLLASLTGAVRALGAGLPPA